MPLDTLQTLVGKVQQRVGPLPDYYLIVDWIVSAAREINRDNEWSWRRRIGQFIFNAAYSIGTCSITRGTNYADFSGSVLDSSMVGRQLRVGGTINPIVTITDITGNRAYFSPAWGEADQVGVEFEIYSAYLPVPSDFDSFASIVDIRRNFQLDWWSYTNQDLDRFDAMRSVGGDTAVCATLRDYTDASAGTVGLVVQVRGSGNKPVSGGSYSGSVDSVFSVEMTSTTVFRWRRDNGPYVSGVTIDPGGEPQFLQSGVTINFPSTAPYTSGDVFVVACSALYSSGVPRYELWPHVRANESRPFIYFCRPPDLVDPGATLSRYIPGELIVEKALAAAARWKSADNPYFDLKLSMLHESRALAMLEDVQREDQARSLSDLVYDQWTSFPTLDANYLAGRDAGFELDVLGY
jgi:hypothetical protein